MRHDEKVSCLKGVPLFAGLDAATIETVAQQAKVRHFAANRCVLTELEFGDDVYVLINGRAQVSVCPRSGERKELGEIGPGSVFGEMASLTGELRSATVRTLTSVDVLVLPDELFDRLRACRPQIATYLVKTLLARLADAERTLTRLLSEPPVSLVDVAAREPRSTLFVLWRELVVNRRRDLAFVALVAFATTLVAVRLLVFLAFKYEWWPRNVLRAAYVSGFILVMVSAGAAILTFRPVARRLSVLAFGIGVALIVNELGVTLAFDIFYQGHALDPDMVFDIEALYRRAEPARAAVIAIALLVQAAYLGSFYHRLWQLLTYRMRRALIRTTDQWASRK